MSDEPFRPRARAPKTGTAFDFILIPVPCSQCGKDDQQPLAELVANDATTCGYCGNVIDLTAEDLHARICEEAEVSKQIKRLDP